MTPREAKILLEHLQKCYRRLESPESMISYMRYIVHFPSDAVQRAVMNWPLKSKWFPTVFELVSEIKSNMPHEPSTSEAVQRGNAAPMSMKFEQFVENDAAIRGFLGKKALPQRARVKEIADESDVHSDG